MSIFKMVRLNTVFIVTRQMYIKGPEERDSSNFDFESLISLFEENKELILKDEPDETYQLCRQQVKINKTY